MVLKGMLPPRPGMRPLLREAEAVGLLRSLLRPDAELNAGRLERCYTTLKVGWGGCCGSARTTVSCLGVCVPGEHKAWPADEP